jgi:hypothetical protein
MTTGLHFNHWQVCVSPTLSVNVHFVREERCARRLVAFFSPSGAFRSVRAIAVDCAPCSRTRRPWRRLRQWRRKPRQHTHSRNYRVSAGIRGFCKRDPKSDCRNILSGAPRKSLVGKRWFKRRRALDAARSDGRPTERRHGGVVHTVQRFEYASLVPLLDCTSLQAASVDQHRSRSIAYRFA